jgi:Na+/melibiose symporter-like transporter
MTTNKPGTAPLTLPQILVYSASALPVASLTLAIFVYLPPYLASHLGISLTVVSTSWALVRFLDIGVDPVLGIVMDRTRTAFGRYRAWMAAGAPVLMLGTYMVFMAPKGIGGTYLVAWLLVLYLGVSIVYLSHSAWAAALATQYDQRSRLFGVLVAAGILAAVAILFVPLLAHAWGLSSAEGVRGMGWFVIGLTPLALGIAIAFTPERISTDVRTHFTFGDYAALLARPELLRLIASQMALVLGPGWMSAMYIFFFVGAWGFTAQQATILLMVYIFSGIAGAVVIGRMAMKISKHHVLMMATTAYSVGLCCVLLVPKGSIPAALPVIVWCGFMAAAFDLIVRAMTADLGDEIRLEQGRERSGLLYALITLAAKIAGALAITVTYPLLAYVGYDPEEGVVNAHSAIVGLEWVFLSGPIVFVMLGGACLIGWKLDAKRHAEIRTALDARDALYDEAAILEGVTGHPAGVLLAAESEPGSV